MPKWITINKGNQAINLDQVVSVRLVSTGSKFQVGFRFGESQDAAKCDADELEAVLRALKEAGIMLEVPKELGF